MVKRFTNLFRNPHLIFWGCIPVLLLIGLIQNDEVKERAIDIAIHDTYFVIAHYHFIKFICYFFLVLGLIYFGLKSLKIELNKTLNTFHTLLTILITFFILYPFNVFKTKQYEGIPKFPEDLNLEISLAGIILLLVQLIFVINIVVSVIRNKKSEV